MTLLSSFASKRFIERFWKSALFPLPYKYVFFVKNNIWTLPKVSLSGFSLVKQNMFIDDGFFSLCWLCFFIISSRSYTTHPKNDLEEFQLEKVEVATVYFSKTVKPYLQRLPLDMFYRRRFSQKFREFC